MHDLASVRHEPEVDARHVRIPEYADAILAAMNEITRIYNSKPTDRDDYRAMWKWDKEYKAAIENLDSLRQKIASKFGATREWKLSKRSFGVQKLVSYNSRKSFDRRQRPPCTDHAYCYIKRRCAIAIVGHEYNFDQQKRANRQAFALANGLLFETPDWVSWWYPRLATVTVWTAVDNYYFY